MMLLGSEAVRLLALLLPSCRGGPGYALDYPTRPVHFIVSFAAGGPNDTIARILGQYLSEQLGQQFIVEDHVGAGGNIGMQDVLASTPDGYTIGFVAPNNAINATLYQHIPFDFVHDSTPIAGTMKLANVMEVNLDFPAKTLPSSSRSPRPSRARSISLPGGVGTSPHMSGELVGDDGRHQAHPRAYRGTAPAMTDLLGGQIPVLFDNLPGSMAQIKAGRSARSASPRRNAWRRFPTCRRSAKPCPATKCRCGSASAGRKACRRDRHQAEHGRQCGAGQARDQGPLPPPWRRSDADEPGRVRQARRRRDREMGQGGEVRGLEGGVSASKSRSR